MKKVLLILVFISISLYSISQSVTTNAASNLTYTEATLNGTFTSLGIYTEFRDGVFEYSVNNDLSASTSIASNPTTTPTAGASATKNLTNLQPLTTYYYRFEATLWKFGIPFPTTEAVVGDIVSFTTPSSLPIIANYSSSLTSFVGYIPTTTTIDTYGDISYIGASSITERGSVWSTSNNPTVDDNKLIYSTSDGTGFFLDIIEGLTAGTNYYINVYATNSHGTAYGEIQQIKTNTIIPTAITATSVTESGLTANWDAVAGAEGYYLDVSTASNFGSFVPGYDNLDVSNVTSYSVVGLSPSTIYYYRVRAYHDGGVDGTAFTSGSSNTISTTVLAAESSVQASQIMWESLNGNIVLNWVDGNGSGNMLIMKASASPTNPSDGQEYTPNTAFGSGSQIGSGTYVIFRSEHTGGTGSVEISNVVAGVDYYFKVLEYTGLDVTTNYNMDDNTDGYGIGNSGSTLLPVDLIYFGAKKTGNSVTIDWSTASEINNDYFVLEHSEDGENFREIATVNGAGNSNITIDYSFEDDRQLQGTNYYRLRQIDFDGKETTFFIVPVNCGINDELLGNIYVDNTNLNVELNSGNYDATMVRLIDISGRDVQFVISKTQGPRTIKLDMSELSKGIYIVRIERGEEVINKKIVY